MECINNEQHINNAAHCLFSYILKLRSEKLTNNRNNIGGCSESIQKLFTVT